MEIKKEEEKKREIINYIKKLEIELEAINGKNKSFSLIIKLYIVIIK